MKVTVTDENLLFVAGVGLNLVSLTILEKMVYDVLLKMESVIYL